MTCPLCKSKQTQHFYSSTKPFKAEYFRCEKCSLIYMDKKFVLSNSEEFKRYESHENEIGDPGYLKFLSRLIFPLKDFISLDMQGLDFGCGPGPALAESLKQEGFKIDLYDPYFYPNKLKDQYDFITATEVVEHFNQPYDSFKKLITLLAENGILGIMTSIKYDSINFDQWYYRHDETHIAFYTPETIDWLTIEFNLKVLKSSENIVIWKKQKAE